MTEVKDPIIVAVELGTSRISGIAGKRKDGSFQILAYAEEQTTACLKRGIVYNVEKTTQSIKNVVEKLSQTLKQQVTRVYVGIGGQSVRSVKKKVPRNMLTTTSITKAHLEDIKNESMEIQIPDYELLENIPQGYIIDSQFTDDPQGVNGKNIEGDFLNIVARKELKGLITTCFNSANINIIDTKLTALELADNVLTEHEKRAGTALVDLGAGTTTVVVYKKNVVRYMVTIPLGFSNIIEDIMSILQIEEKEATDILLNHGNAYITSGDEMSEITQTSYTTSNKVKVQMTKIFGIIDARLTEIIANAVAQIVKSKYSDSLLAGLVITGGGSNLKNIDKAFKDNPIKLKFDTIRVAKSVVTPIIKSTSAASLNPDNAMSGSIISLVLSGTENCVGEGNYDGEDIFGAAENKAKTQTNITRSEEEMKRIDALMVQLDGYKDRMRTAIQEMKEKRKVLENETVPRRVKEEAKALLAEAKDICGEEFHNLVDSLEIKLNNDQRITSANNLEIQLVDEIEEMEKALKTAKDGDSVFGKFTKWLGKIVNED